MFEFNTNTCTAYNYNPATRFGDISDRHYSTTKELLDNPEYQASQAISKAAINIAGYIPREEYKSLMAKAKAYERNALRWQAPVEKIDWTLDDIDTAAVAMIPYLQGSMHLTFENGSVHIITPHIQMYTEVKQIEVGPGVLYLDTDSGKFWLKFAR